MTGIYIHIPFCKQACSYCDFYFSTRKQLIDPFVEALIFEIESYRDSAFTINPVKTIYLGGGTPSLLNEHQLTSIFEALHSVFETDPEEVTIEVNPDDVSDQYLKMLIRLNVDRLSIGIQSFQEELLTFMHRAHNREEALKALESIQNTGFPSFTADLIYGNPGQSVQMLEKDIQQLLHFDPPHISAYSLTVEPKTRLGKQVELGRIRPPDDEAVAEHFDCVELMLKDGGLHRYEVSNFAKSGREAHHNSNYWNHQNYLGFGPSAHSFWWDRTSARRWNNRPELKEYLTKPAAGIVEENMIIPHNSLAEERLFLGLRTLWGVSETELRERYQYELSEPQLEWIHQQSVRGIVTFHNKILKMTGTGLKISDLLVVDLLSKK